MQALWRLIFWSMAEPCRVIDDDAKRFVSGGTSVAYGTLPCIMCNFACLCYVQHLSIVLQTIGVGLRTSEFHELIGETSQGLMLMLASAGLHLAAASNRLEPA